MASIHPTETLLTRRVLKLMGNRFEVSVCTQDETFAHICIDAAVAEVRRIEALLTTFDSSSQTNAINEAAGIAPVRVDQEVFDLVARSLRISKLTQGAFDITYGSIDKRLWNFDTSMTALPDAALARASVRLIDYRNVLLDADACTVFLKHAGMRIGFGGIGKGYAADRAKKILLDMGVQSGVVNAAGDLTAWGLQPSGQSWTIGIADPDNSTHPFSQFAISNMAVATSGHYEKYAVIGGKKYGHTIDPATGLPVAGIKSVTVICPAAELADALTTPLMVMGIPVALNLVNQMKQVACVMIDDDNNIYTSNNIKIS